MLQGKSLPKNFALNLLLLCSLGSVQADLCPSYMHKDDAPFGLLQNAPEGYYLFTKGPNIPGLFKSPIRTYAPVVVPGTEAEFPTQVDMSDDGKWAVYTAVIYDRTDGSSVVDTSWLVGLEKAVKVGVPTLALPFKNYLDKDDFRNPAQVRFYHTSPKGTEIFYYCYNFNGSGDAIMRAVAVDFSGAIPTFGATRTILKIDTTASNYHILHPWPSSNIVAVCKDQIFGLFGIKSIRGMGKWHNDFVTIPDNGNGMATNANFYQWTAEPTTDLWGCGQTISRDGSLCLTNSGAVGSSCVPNKNQPTGVLAMDHKGFYITPFLRTTDQRMSIDQQVDSAGISINWCPLESRTGDWNNGYNQWAFSNVNDYVIGHQKGTALPNQGIWIVNWQTNMWTLLTPPGTDTVYEYPQAFITDDIGVIPRNSFAHQRTGSSSHIVVQPIRSNNLVLPAGKASAKVFGLDGSVLWQYHRTHTRNPVPLQIPRALRQQILIITFESAHKLTDQTRP